MNEPVRILDLALQMIKRAGKRPFLDIDIAIVGARPGEKLCEELFYPWEQLTPTTVAGVRAAIPNFDPAPRMRKFEELLAAAQARDVDWVKRTLIEIVPEFEPFACGSASAKPVKPKPRVFRTQGAARPARRSIAVQPA
jgi:O-antigen biosynthesis protein WbqV